MPAVPGPGEADDGTRHAPHSSSQFSQFHQQLAHTQNTFSQVSFPPAPTIIASTAEVSSIQAYPLELHDMLCHCLRVSTKHSRLRLAMRALFNDRSLRNSLASVVFAIMAMKRSVFRCYTSQHPC